MNDTSQPRSAWHKFLQFPFTRIMIGVFMILTSVLITQFVVTAHRSVN